MRKILNIGSMNNDYVYGVPRFVMPGETLAVEKMSLFPGGKGLNQSVALARAGANVSHAGKIGKDGEMLIDILNQAGVNTSLISTNGTKTGHTIIQVTDTGENCILLYSGANNELDREQIVDAISRFQADDILLLQNEVNDIAFIMERAYENGMKIAFNPSPFDHSVLQYPLHTVSWFLLNEIEGTEITGKTDQDELLQSMSELYPNAAIVLTAGKAGVLYRDASQCLEHGIYDVPVVDTTGAGDTFTGFFLASIVANKTVAEALERASIASSIAVSRSGAASSIPTLEEVLTSNF